ncbi:MAG TPA: ABC transporter permease subunit [Candidatus Limnocylindrales bacterium]|nr:ABC transporter permease subunit [Candidatus Limnocylindrales bacterium]
MAGLGPLLRKELLEQWRTLRLPVIATIFLLVGLSSPLLARFTPEIIKAVAGDQFPMAFPTPTAADAIDQFAKNIGQFGGLIAVLLAMGAVATEKERGTAALLLTKPVSRAAFLIAKLVAIGLTLAVSVVIATAGAWFYTLVLFESLPPAGVAAGAVLQWLMLMAWASITFVGSTLTRSSLAAAGLGIVAFIVVGILGVLPTVGQFLPTGLSGPARALALGVPGPDAIGPTVATMVLIGAAGSVAWLAFRRQEL